MISIKICNIYLLSFWEKRIKGIFTYIIPFFLKYHNLRDLRDKDSDINFTIKRILWYKAPVSQVKTMTIGAFLLAESYYQSYLNGNTSDLNKLIACFYCSNKGFDERLIDKHARVISMAIRMKRAAIGSDYGSVREKLKSIYPYAFWYLKEIGRIYKCRNLVDTFEYMGTGHESSLMKELALLNSHGRMFFNNKSRPILYKTMFLDSVQAKFPDIKILTPDQVMLQDGVFLNPKHN